MGDENEKEKKMDLEETEEGVRRKGKRKSWRRRRMSE